MADLFSNSNDHANDDYLKLPNDLSFPLASRLRPKSLDEYAGQKHLFGPNKPLYKAIKNGKPHSMILWGPPGTGKTTLAKIIASQCDCHFIALSAVLGSVKDIRKAVEQAKLKRQLGTQTLLFVDEVHRFNKSQQDAFLPYVEDGTFIFIGATTENPSFEVNNALLSRAKTYVLKSLDSSDLQDVLDRALQSYTELTSEPLELSAKAANLIIAFADGDARRLLNLFELVVEHLQLNKIDRSQLDKSQTDKRRLPIRQIEEKDVEPFLKDSFRRFDNGGEAFYDQISALHKSVRGSNPDGALYWFCRMLDGGCDPLYIARRVVRMASEDIGNADPRALQVANSAWDVQQRLGSPEGELAIAQAVIYLAVAPKSNAVYKAFNQCMADIQQNKSFDVPLHLRNAPTTLMKDLDYGKTYRYDHDEPDGFSAGQTYLPDELIDSTYYQPVNRGLEQKVAEKLAHLRQLSKRRQS